MWIERENKETKAKSSYQVRVTCVCIYIEF